MINSERKEREGLSHRKGPRTCWLLKSSQLLQMLKDAFRRYRHWICCWENVLGRESQGSFQPFAAVLEVPKGQSGQPCGRAFEKIKRVARPSQQKPGMRRELSKKDPGGRGACLTDWIAMTYIGDPQGYREFYTSRNAAVSGWQSKDETKGDRQTPNNVTGRKQGDKNSQLQILAPLQEKGRVIPQFGGETLNHKGYSQTLKPDIFLAWFQNCLGLATPFSFPFFPPFWMGVSITGIPFMVHPCIFGADKLFSSFTGPELERNFAPG